MIYGIVDKIDTKELIEGDTTFYKIKEGSGKNYSYSKLKLKDVPERFLSEVMYEVYKITLNNKGIDEKYKR